MPLWSVIVSPIGQPGNYMDSLSSFFLIVLSIFILGDCAITNGRSFPTYVFSVQFHVIYR